MLIQDRNKTILFDVWPPSDTHPYSNEWLNVTLEAILDTGVDLDDVVRPVEKKTLVVVDGSDRDASSYYFV